MHPQAGPPRGTRILPLDPLGSARSLWKGASEPMNWEQARRLLRLGRERPAASRLGSTAVAEVGSDPHAAVRAASVCVASGKGGTGKSVVSASLATLLAPRGRTLLFDADLGVGNAHILQDVSPDHSLADVVDGGMDLALTVAPCRPQLDLLPGGSGYAKLASPSARELHVIGLGIEQLELGYRHLLVDSAAGISNQTVTFAAASDVVLLVTTPDVTALTDAYAFLKVLLQRRPTCLPLLVVNRATSEEEARSAADRISSVSKKFLQREPRYVGFLPEDRAAFRSIQHRRPVVIDDPQSALARALNDLGLVIMQELGRHHPHGFGRTLMRHVGYTPSKG
jgi:flagellar biosynthesis protein FlhG